MSTKPTKEELAEAKKHLDTIIDSIKSLKKEDLTKENLNKLIDTLGPIIGEDVLQSAFEKKLKEVTASSGMRMVDVIVTMPTQLHAGATNKLKAIGAAAIALQAMRVGVAVAAVAAGYAGAVSVGAAIGGFLAGVVAVNLGKAALKHAASRVLANRGRRKAGDHKWIKGPRGGVYYIDRNGDKVYRDDD